jgi:hypothetical protein
MSELDVLDETDIVWPDGELVTVSSIDSWSEHARQTVTPTLSDSVVRGPDWVIRELDLVSHMAGQMVVVVKNAGALRRVRARALKRARAEARGRHRTVKGAEQTAMVDLDVEDEQAEYDEAVIAEEYARHIADLVSERKSTIQSMGRQVEILFRDAGRGL